MIIIGLNSALVLGMVNIGLNSASLLGISLAVAGAGLYFLRTVRPELSRDYDIFFSAAGILCGGILLFYGWLLEPVLQFEHLMLAGSTIFFAVEAIRLRGIAAEQARRNTPIVDRERPVSRTQVYQEPDYDRIESYETEPRYDNPRLGGYSEPRPARRRGYESEDPRTPKNMPAIDRYGYPEQTRKRRTKNPNPPETDRYDGWDDTQTNWEDGSTYYSKKRRPRPENQYSGTRSQPSNRRRRSNARIERTSAGYLEPTSSDYVDYQPLDRSNNLNNDDSYRD